MARKWVSAGVRADQHERARRAIGMRNYTNQMRVRQEHERERDLEIGKRKWAEGMVIPHQITAALNMRDLFGPDVDRACGAKEPDVDLWEAGKLYPSWEQIVLLAELPGKPTNYFMAPIRQELSLDHTSMRFHVPFGECDPILIC